MVTCQSPMEAHVRALRILQRMEANGNPSPPTGAEPGTDGQQWLEVRVRLLLRENEILAARNSALHRHSEAIAKALAVANERLEAKVKPTSPTPSIGTMVGTVCALREGSCWAESPLDFFVLLLPLRGVLTTLLARLLLGTTRASAGCGLHAGDTT